MAEHALMSPSGASKWLRCVGSLAMEKPFPNTTNKFAEEGTDAHQLGEMTLLSDHKDAAEFIGFDLERGHVASEDMAANVQLYVDAVLEYADGNELFIEQRVDFSSFIGVEDSFGTADAVVVNYEQKELVVIDLKYGMGEVVAEKNEQLSMYALGALNEFGFLCEFETVRLVISQPRVRSAPSEWSMPMKQLLAFANNAKPLAIKAAACVTGDAVSNDMLTPGEKQCQWCRAKATCPALAAEVSEATEADFDDVGQDQLPPITEGLSQKMAKVNLIEGWCKAIRTKVFDELASGNNVEGYKLVQGRQGSRAWTDPVTAEDTLKRMRLKDDERFTRKVISPTQAEKILKKVSPRKWTKLQEIITRKDGAPSVAPESDKRDAISIANTAEDFADV